MSIDRQLSRTKSEASRRCESIGDLDREIQEQCSESVYNNKLYSANFSHPAAARRHLLMDSMKGNLKRQHHKARRQYNKALISQELEAWENDDQEEREFHERQEELLYWEELEASQQDQWDREELSYQLDCEVDDCWDAHEWERRDRLQLHDHQMCY